MDALAVPSPKISMGTIYQVTKLMDDKHVVTHAGFLALPPPTKYTVHVGLSGVKDWSQRVWQRKKVHTSSAPKNGQLHNEPVVHFRKTGLVYR